MFYFDSAGNNNVNKYNKHYHNVCEFYFLVDGQCNYLIENKLYVVNKGDIVFVPKGIIHETSYIGSHSRILINCSDDFFGSLPYPGFKVFRNINCINEIQNIFNCIKEEYALSDNFSSEIIKGYMQRLIAITARNQNFYQDNRISGKYIELALKYIHNNFCSDITLTAVAEKFGVTKEHFSRIFKKETGLNFIDYLSQLRLKKAEEMLCYSNESVSEIAYACGFNDSNYFSDKFKRLHNCSPLKYRKRNRDINQNSKE